MPFAETRRRARARASRPCTPAALLMAMAAILAACSPALNWRQVVLGGGVQVLFPCKTAQRERAAVPLDGRSVPIAQVACEASGMTFAVMTVTLPDAADGAATVRSLVASTAGNVDGRVEAASPEAADSALGASGQRFSVSGRRTDGVAVRLEMLAIQRGARLYQAVVVAPGPDADAVATFFDGVRSGVAAGPGSR